MSSPSPPLLPTHSPHGSPIDERHSPIHNLLNKSSPRGSPSWGEKNGKHMVS
jgi:hypothetical protein